VDAAPAAHRRLAMDNTALRACVTHSQGPSPRCRPSSTTIDKERRKRQPLHWHLPQTSTPSQHSPNALLRIKPEFEKTVLSITLEHATTHAGLSSFSFDGVAARGTASRQVHDDNAP